MKNCRFNDDLNNIKNRYQFEIYYYSHENTYTYNHELNYIHFRTTMSDLHLEKKFELLKAKFTNLIKNKIDIQKTLNNQNLLDGLISEYNNIKKEAKEKYESSNELLRKIREDYIKNKEKKDVKITFDKVCHEIIDSNTKEYIRYEKALILIVDKFNLINI